MDQLSRALDEISYEWLMEQHPALVTAIEEEIHQGATPARIKQCVLLHTQRLELALRCEQAARHITRNAEERELPPSWDGLTGAMPAAAGQRGATGGE